MNFKKKPSSKRMIERSDHESVNLTNEHEISTNNEFFDVQLLSTKLWWKLYLIKSIYWPFLLQQTWPLHWIGQKLNTYDQNAKKNSIEKAKTFKKKKTELVISLQSIQWKGQHQRDFDQFPIDFFSWNHNWFLKYPLFRTRISQ